METIWNKKIKKEVDIKIIYLTLTVVFIVSFAYVTPTA